MRGLAFTCTKRGGGESQKKNTSYFLTQEKNFKFKWEKPQVQRLCHYKCATWLNGRYVQFLLTWTSHGKWHNSSSPTVMWNQEERAWTELLHVPGRGREARCRWPEELTSTEDLPPSHARHALRAPLHPLLPTISQACYISMPISEGKKLRLTELKALAPSLMSYWQNQDLSSGLPGSLALGKGSWLASLWEQSESPWRREENGKGRGSEQEAQRKPRQQPERLFLGNPGA